MTPSLTTKLHAIDTLHPNPRNPRKHNARQIQKLSNSIKAFGFNIPVLINRQNQVLCGHGRLLAARKLGLQEVPVIQIEHLTPEQEKLFAIADNRLTEIAEWDDALLGEIFLELSELDLDLELTGFTMGEIDLKIEGLDETPMDDPADRIEETPGPAVTQPGDRWLLNNHRLLCADSLVDASYELLMGEQQADVIFTDPPYNVPVEGHVCGKGNIHHREFAMASGEMDSDEFQQFLATIFARLIRFSRSGSIHFICIDWRHLPEILNAGTPLYHELKNICVWVNDRGGMGSLYRSQHELVLVFKHGTAAHRNNVELGKHGRNRTNVWEYPGVGLLSQQSGENLLALHPTVKPVAMIADALMDCSARGDIVLDPFLGSGSTLLAAHRVGRTCYGIELDPLYVDVAIRRWQNITGHPAIHAATGQTFDERQHQQEQLTDDFESLSPQSSTEITNENPSVNNNVITPNTSPDVKEAGHVEI